MRVQLMKGGKVVAEFSDGDIVRLKSGGPPMTITGHDDYSGKLVCQWVVSGAEPKIGLHSFPPETLERRPEDQIK